MKALLFLCFLVGSLAITCGSATNCATCNGDSSACATCPEEFYMNVATCTGCTTTDCKTCAADTCSVCKDKFYLITNPSISCGSCHTDCATCKDANTANNCLKCATTGVNIKFTVVSTADNTGTCTAACASTGVYDDANICKACDTSCKTCTAGTANDCLTCDTTGANGKFTELNDVAKTGTCKGTCGDGTYDLSNICTKCVTANCKTCATNVCSVCLDGYYNSAAANAAFVCTGCSVTDCKTCTKDTCNECKDGYFMKTENSVTTCTVCTSPCATCSTSATTCTSCLDNKYVQDGGCVADCSEGYTKDDTNKVCNKNFGGYLFSGLAILIAVLTLI